MFYYSESTEDREKIVLHPNQLRQSCSSDDVTDIIRLRSSGALMVEVWICTTMALQNLQQYGCQTGNKLKEKSRDLNRNSSRNKNETMFGSGYENCPEFGVLGGVIFKLDIL